MDLTERCRQAVAQATAARKHAEAASRRADLAGDEAYRRMDATRRRALALLSGRRDAD